MARMTARYRGRCTGCGEAILPGQEIEHSRTQGAFHINCLPDHESRDAELAETLDILQRLTAEMKSGPQTQTHTDGEVLLRTNRMRWLADDTTVYYQDADGTWQTSWNLDIEITLSEIASRLAERNIA
jgi:hypothetical protein